MVNHHQPHRAEGDAEPHDVGDEPGAEELVAVDREADAADDQAGNADHQRARAAGVDVGRRGKGRPHGHGASGLGASPAGAVAG